MSEAPIMKAFKELEEGKIFKDGGTQTEKEDSPASNSHFYTPERVFTGFSLFACLLALVFSATRLQWWDKNSFSMQTCGVLQENSELDIQGICLE